MKYIINYFWSIVWTIFMFFLMILPSQSLQGAPSFPGFDKMAHCGTFFVLTVLLYWQHLVKHRFVVKKWAIILKVLVITLIFAGATELAQKYFAPSRTADWWDFFADSTGIGMGTFAFILFFRNKRY